MISFDNTADRFQFLISDNGTNNTFIRANAFGSPQVDTWYLITAWHDSVNDEIGIQINDNHPDTLSHTTGVLDGVSDFIIGAFSSPATGLLDGRVSQTALWKNRVLNESERNGLFNGGFGYRHSNLPSQYSSNLESYWNLDEASGTRVDSEGSNDLTDNGSVTRNTGPNPAEDSSFSSSSSIEFSSFSSSSGPNSAADFNGIDQYLSIADNTSLSMGDIDMSITLWVYLDNKATVTFISKWIQTGSNNKEYMVSYDAPSDRLQFLVSGDGVTTNFVRAHNYGAPKTDTWYLVTAWHDSVNNEIGIRVNDGVQNTVSHSTGIYDGLSPFRVGAFDSPITGFLDGRVASVCIWKNRIITDLESNLMWNGGVALTHEDTPNGMIEHMESFWNLDEHSGTRFDAQGNNNLADNNNVGFTFEPVANMDSSLSSSSQSNSVSSSSSTREFSSFSSSTEISFSSSSTFLSFTSTSDSSSTSSSSSSSTVGMTTSSSTSLSSTSDSSSTSSSTFALDTSSSFIDSTSESSSSSTSSVNSSSSTFESLTSSTTAAFDTSSSNESSSSDRSFSTESSSTSSSSTLASYTSSTSSSSIEFSTWTSSSTENILSTSSEGTSSSTNEETTSSSSTEESETSSESSRSTSSMEFVSFSSSSTSSSTSLSTVNSSSSSSEQEYTINKLPSGSAIGLWLRMTVTPSDTYNADDFFTIYVNPVDQLGIEGVENFEYRLHHTRLKHSIGAHQGLYLRSQTNFVRAHFEHQWRS